MLFDLPLHHLSRWIFNCYLVEDTGDGRPLVVDAGLPCTAGLAAPLVSGTPRIAATHGHSDHVGGITRLLDRAAEVLLPARCEAYLGGEPARTPGPREVAKILPVFADQPFDLAALREFGSATAGYGRTPRMTVPFPVSGYLSDGDRLGDWEILAAPGHSDDSTCFYHPASETLISGDAILTHDGRAWFNPEIVDPVRSRATEERLRELSVRHLLPGHGLPLAGVALLRDARSFRERPPGPGMLARLSRSLGRW
ncbi:MAG: MBL fold metallo-hydrolase [Myxococcales bacterium]|nr:MBL fold metallo-hydrolase [Myxococcales bacterium]